MKTILEYLGIIERAGTLVELNMGSGEVECDICKVDLTSPPGNAELSLKQIKN